CVKQFLDEWFAAAEIFNGKLFRFVCRSGRVFGDGMTQKVVWHVVKTYGKKLEIPKLAPHDLKEVVFTVLPRCRRRIGTNSILAGARVRTNNRALPGTQTKIS